MSRNPPPPEHDKTPIGQVIQSIHHAIEAARLQDDLPAVRDLTRRLHALEAELQSYHEKDL